MQNNARKKIIYAWVWNAAKHLYTHNRKHTITSQYAYISESRTAFKGWKNPILKYNQSSEVEIYMQKSPTFSQGFFLNTE